MMRFKKTLTVFVAALFAAVLFSSSASGLTVMGYTGDYDEPIGLTDEGAKGTKLNGVVYLELYPGWQCYEENTGRDIGVDEGTVCDNGSVASPTNGDQRIARVVLRLRHGKNFSTLYGGGIYIPDAGEPTQINTKIIGAMEEDVLRAFGMTGSIVIKNLDEFGRVNTKYLVNEAGDLIPVGNEIILSDIVLIVQD